MKISVKEEKSVTCVIYFQNFSYPATHVYEKGNPHMHTCSHLYTHVRAHTRAQRETVIPTIGKCAKQIRLKTEKLKFILMFSLNIRIWREVINIEDINIHNRYAYVMYLFSIK